MTIQCFHEPRVQWLAPDSSEWEASLAHMRHDIYHLPQYVLADSEEVGAQPTAFHIESGASSMLVPMLKRNIPKLEKYKDSISPYGYGGPIWSPAVDSAVAEKFISLFKNAGAEAGLVSSFFRLHPLLDTDVFRAIIDPDVFCVKHGATVSIDLLQSTDVLERSVRSNHRRNVKKLRENGFTVRFNCWDDYDRFQAIYSETMKRLGATSNYFFSKEYFGSLLERLEDYLVLCSVVAANGELASGGLFSFVKGLAQYHLGATNSKYLTSAPSKLMFIEAREYFKALGGERLHLGGGLSSAEDNLYLFKLGFGTDTHTFRTLRIIHDRKKYDQLTTSWERKTGRSAPGIEEFFPPYRST